MPENGTNRSAPKSVEELAIDGGTPARTIPLPLQLRVQVADSLFERSILFAIPSCLSEQDEDDIIRALYKVLSHFLAPAPVQRA
jgi:hypothetical protein